MSKLITMDRIILKILTICCMVVIATPAAAQIDLVGRWEGRVERSLISGNSEISRLILNVESQDAKTFDGRAEWKGRKYDVKGKIQGDQIYARMGYAVIRGQMLENQQLSLVASYTRQGKPVASTIMSRDGGSTVSQPAVMLASAAPVKPAPKAVSTAASMPVNKLWDRVWSKNGAKETGSAEVPAPAPSRIAATRTVNEKPAAVAEKQAPKITTVAKADPAPVKEKPVEEPAIILASAEATELRSAAPVESDLPRVNKASLLSEPVVEDSATVAEPVQPAEPVKPVETVEFVEPEVEKTAEKEMIPEPAKAEPVEQPVVIASTEDEIRQPAAIEPATQEDDAFAHKQVEAFDSGILLAGVPEVKPLSAESPQSVSPGINSSANGNKFVVQVGAYANKLNAEKERKRFNSRGYLAIINTQLHPRLGKLYLVHLNPKSESDSPQTLVARVKREENIEAFVRRIGN